MRELDNSYSCNSNAAKRNGIGKAARRWLVMRVGNRVRLE